VKLLEAAQAKKALAHSKYEKACSNIEVMHTKVQTRPKLKSDLASLLLDLRPIRDGAIAALAELNASRQAVYLQFEQSLQDYEKIERNLHEEVGKALIDLSQMLSLLVANYEKLSGKLRDGVGGLSSREDVETTVQLEVRPDEVVSVRFDPPALNFDVTAIENVDIPALFGEELRKSTAHVIGENAVVTVIGDEDGIVTVELGDGTTMTKRSEDIEIVFRRKLARLQEDGEYAKAGEVVLVVGVADDAAACETVFGQSFAVASEKLVDI
jgi:hypothetical protein